MIFKKRINIQKIMAIFIVSAQARFLKQDKKAAREALKEGNTSQQTLKITFCQMPRS